MNNHGVRMPEAERVTGAGHAKTIKQRRIEVYLPSLERKDAWSQEARARGQSLSVFVFSVVEDALSADAAEAEQRADELEGAVADLTNESAALRQRIQELETLNDRMDRDLEEYRAQDFLREEPVRKLDPRLIRVLSDAKTRYGRARVVGEAELHRVLRLKRQDETRLKALARQLEFLELHEIVRKSGKGWMWIG